MNSTPPNWRLAHLFLAAASPLVLAYYAAAFYPGYLTFDSLYMLGQGAGLQPMSNWHPPFVTLLWGALFSVFKSAGGIWLVQICAYIGAVLWFVTRLNRSWVAIVAYVLLLLYPPIFTNMAALWKDCWAVIGTLLCATCTLDYIHRRNRASLLACAVFFVITCLIRIDYAIITLPFLVGAVAVSHPARLGLGGWRDRRLWAVMSVIVIMMSCVKLAGLAVTDKLNPWLPIAVWDIAGVEKNTPLRPKIPGYRCATSDPLVFDTAPKFKLNLPENRAGTDLKEESATMLALWRNAVLGAPLAYLEHRICVAKHFLAIGTEQVHYPYPAASLSESLLTQRANRSALNLDLYWFFDRHAHGPMFRLWCYLAFSLLAFGISYLIGRRSLAATLTLLSILLCASRIVILPAADFRYGLWIVVGTVVLLSELLDRAAMPPGSRPDASTIST